MVFLVLQYFHEQKCCRFIAFLAGHLDYLLVHLDRFLLVCARADDDSHVETRLCQYEAYKSSKGLQIAKELVKGKVQGQDLILEKYGFKRHSPITDVLEGIVSDGSRSVKTRLLSVEGRCTRRYFSQIFKLFPEQLRPESRKTFKAYDGLNNIFNLAYEVLQWKVHQALLMLSSNLIWDSCTLRHGANPLSCATSWNYTAIWLRISLFRTLQASKRRIS